MRGKFVNIPDVTTEAVRQLGGLFMLLPIPSLRCLIKTSLLLLLPLVSIYFSLFWGFAFLRVLLLLLVYPSFPSFLLSMEKCVSTSLL